MRFLILLTLFSSCISVGPNYNQGKTHNERLQRREGIVMKQDKNSKKQMYKSRNKARRIKTKKLNIKNTEDMFNN